MLYTQGCKAPCALPYIQIYKLIKVNHYRRAWRVGVEKPMTCFSLNLLIIPRRPKRSGFGVFVKNTGIGMVEFIALGSTKSFVAIIER